MSLRRFPWKMPRQTDVSYKLFSAAPTPGFPTVESLRRSSHTSLQSASQTSTHSDATSAGASPSDDQLDGGPVERTSTVADSHNPREQPSIKGPWRLLRLLPRESRYIVGRMLDTDPRTRATMKEFWADPWVASCNICRQEGGGRVVRAPGHEHVLEPGNAQPPVKEK